MIGSKRFNLVLSILAIILFATALLGCSKGYDLEFGSDSDSASKINILNDTGLSIVALEFTSDDTVTEISNSVISGSLVWESGKTAQISYTDSDCQTVLFKAGETTYVMHNLDLKNVEKATLKLDGEYAYLEYVKDGNTLSTLDDEKAYLKAKQEQKEAEQKAKEEAEAKAKAEEEATQAQAQSDYSQSTNSQSSSDSGSSSVQQSEDSCIDISKLKI